MKKSKCKSYIKDLEETIRLMDEEFDEFILERNDFEDTIKNLQSENESNKRYITTLEEETEEFKNKIKEQKSEIETLECEWDNFRVENDSLKKENKKLKETGADLKESLLVSQHVVLCQEETISILKNQNKQDNNRYNGLLKIISNLT